MAIIYGTLYMMFAAFPIVYQQNRHWSEGIGGLAFLGVAVGMIGAVIYTIPDNKRYLKAEAAGIDKGEGGSYFPSSLYLCSSQSGAPEHCLGAPVLPLKAEC